MSLMNLIKKLISRKILTAYKHVIYKIAEYITIFRDWKLKVVSSLFLSLFLCL